MTEPFVAAEDELIRGKFDEIPIFDWNPALTTFK
jgi:hypothetical protein